MLPYLPYNDARTHDMYEASYNNLWCSHIDEICVKWELLQYIVT